MTWSIHYRPSVFFFLLSSTVSVLSGSEISRQHSEYFWRAPLAWNWSDPITEENVDRVARETLRRGLYDTGRIILTDQRPAWQLSHLPKLAMKIAELQQNELPKPPTWMVGKVTPAQSTITLSADSWISVRPGIVATDLVMYCPQPAWLINAREKAGERIINDPLLAARRAHDRCDSTQAAEHYRQVLLSNAEEEALDEAFTWLLHWHLYRNGIGHEIFGAVVFERWLISVDQWQTWRGPFIKKLRVLITHLRQPEKTIALALQMPDVENSRWALLFRQIHPDVKPAKIDPVSGGVRDF